MFDIVVPEILEKHTSMLLASQQSSHDFREEGRYLRVRKQPETSSTCVGKSLFKRILSHFGARPAVYSVFVLLSQNK